MGGSLAGWVRGCVWWCWWHFGVQNKKTVLCVTVKTKKVPHRRRGGGSWGL